MPTYTTEYVKNLSTGKPFVFEVSTESLERLKLQKRLVGEGRAPMLASTVEELVKNFELSCFGAFDKIVEIFINNGFTTELITKILQDFGVSEPFIRKLLEDDAFISRMKPWFEGITCDGGRAIRTLAVVYDSVKAFFSATGKSEWDLFTEMDK
jgi:hypothetical protein